MTPCSAALHVASTITLPCEPKQFTDAPVLVEMDSRHTTHIEVSRLCSEYDRRTFLPHQNMHTMLQGEETADRDEGQLLRLRLVYLGELVHSHLAAKKPTQRTRLC